MADPPAQDSERAWNRTRATVKVRRLHEASPPEEPAAVVGEPDEGLVARSRRRLGISGTLRLTSQWVALRRLLVD